MQRFQFHPVIARWFEQKFGTPTRPQEEGWPAIQSGSHTLIAAPTGSGKTLAAFLCALDALFREGLTGPLPDETRVLYVSPLKALSNDIHKNLLEPLAGIREALQSSEGRDVHVRAEVRTGDTPAAKRQAIAKKPPHILVTTPESFYLLLTSASGRKMLSTVRTLIVDEIHAVVANRRGSHLALSMERLEALVQHPLQRVGLSATQKPIDVLAQQLVATVACEDWDEQNLFDLVRSAYPYRDLTREEFNEVLRMLAEGFSTKRGRRAALVHHDAIHHRVRGRRGARLVALTSGGAIPDNADYRVVVEPSETFIGSVNEDFAVESMAGDIFQLGNASWRILRVNSGMVRVEDAQGQPPGIPFWLGEGPARTTELSSAVSMLRDEAETGIPEAAARQIADYFGATYKTLGVLPSQTKLVIERFFDESGGMQLVIHSPFGARLNRAWGLALRKRFCRSFNFELQAAATDDAIVLSLGTQHSFPLDEVFHYLHSGSVRGILVQALLDAPMFGIRWRWNATRALALPRQRGGRKIPAPIQRMESENLLAAVFPDQLACLENIAGDRDVPDHPLVRQTIEDCLTEVMDIHELEALLRRIETGGVRCVTLDLPEPSPLAHEILNARPYAFLDRRGAITAAECRVSAGDSRSAAGAAGIRARARLGTGRGGARVGPGPHRGDRSDHGCGIGGVSRAARSHRLVAFPA